MKLQNELKNLVELIRAKTSETVILEHTENVRPEIAKSLRMRVVFDVGRYCVGSETICRWYREYSCHDEHVYTLFKAAFKEVYPEIYRDVLTF